MSEFVIDCDVFADIYYARFMRGEDRNLQPVILIAHSGRGGPAVVRYIDWLHMQAWTRRTGGGGASSATGAKARQGPGTAMGRALDF